MTKWHGRLEVDEDHDEVIDPAAETGGNEPDGAADDGAEERPEHGYQHGQLNGYEEPAQQVAAQVVRPQKVEVPVHSGAARRQQPGQQRRVLIVVRHDPLGGSCHDQDRQEPDNSRLDQEGRGGDCPEGRPAARMWLGLRRQFDLCHAYSPELVPNRCRGSMIR